jgi:hypothetical protein
VAFFHRPLLSLSAGSGEGHKIAEKESPTVLAVELFYRSKLPKNLLTTKRTGANITYI